VFLVLLNFPKPITFFIYASASSSSSSGAAAALVPFVALTFGRADASVLGIGLVVEALGAGREGGCDVLVDVSLESL